MSRQEEALRNLKIDAGFFQHMLRNENQAPEEFRNFDVYLMEKSLMPLLLQGLDALSRHVDQMQSGRVGDAGSRARFNPLVWLAQYLLRNNPANCRDKRSPMYKELSELANVERGRRNLLKKRAQVEEVFAELERGRDEDEPPTVGQLPLFFNMLDEAWHLRGELVAKLPKDFKGIYPHEEVVFETFWPWFEDYIRSNDLLREEAFSDAANRQLEEERSAELAERERERREARRQAANEKRATLDDRFESTIAEMYVDEEINRILNKGAVLDGVEEMEGSPPIRGNHIALILTMMGLWGVQVSDEAPPDLWGDDALAAWRNWLAKRGLLAEDEDTRVDAQSLRALMEKGTYQEWLIRAYPSEDVEAGEDHRQMQIRGELFDEDGEIIAEALDDETGEVWQLPLPESQIDDIRRRLQEGEPVMAQVDLLSGLITTVVPAYS